MLLLSLIGEQPIPNLLPVRYLQPGETLLVYTGRTERVARRMQRLLAGQPDLHGHPLVDPYDYARIQEKIRPLVAARPDVIYNLTGGTKMMVLAAYDLAAETGSPFLYLQSEQRKSILYRYAFQDGIPVLQERVELPTLLTASDYLNAYLDGFAQEGFHRDEHGKLDDGGLFEQAVYQALHSRLDEVLASVRPQGVAGQIEIDLVLRCGNQVGIAEVKLGGKDSGKRGLDQLKMAGESTYLGSYTAQFLITAAFKVSDKIRTLAAERGVTLLQIPSYQEGHPIPRQDADRLAERIRQRLGV